jgi:hypothetical protein
MLTNDMEPDRNVVRTTTSASELKAKTLPALKPNHPIHNRRMARVSQVSFTLNGT